MTLVFNMKNKDEQYEVNIPPCFYPHVAEESFKQQILVLHI